MTTEQAPSATAHRRGRGHRFGVWLGTTPAVRITATVLAVILPILLPLLWSFVWPWINVVMGVVLVIAVIATAWGDFARKSDIADHEARIRGLTKQVEESKRAKRLAEEDVEQLEDQYSELVVAIEDEVRKALGRLANEFGLDSDDRLTLYQVLNDDLVIAVRFSSSVTKQHVSPDNVGRRFSMEFGLIGVVHDSGVRKSRPGGPPPGRRVDYRRWQRDECYLMSEDFPSLRIKSQHYEVVAIKDGNGDNARVLGVVTAESTNGPCQHIADLADALDDTNNIHHKVLKDGLVLLASTVRGREEPESEE